MGPGRLLFGAAFLGLALFLTPALFGRVPQSQVLEPAHRRPAPAGLQRVQHACPGRRRGRRVLKEVKATSTDPAQAEREQKSFHGVLWGMSLDQAREQAAAENKPILIDFTGVNCATAGRWSKASSRGPTSSQLLRKFVTVQLYTDYVPIGSITPEQTEKRAELNQDRLIDMAQETTNPFYVVLSPNGEVIGKIGGYDEPRVFTEFLNKALEKLPQEARITQTDSPDKPL